MNTCKISKYNTCKQFNNTTKSCKIKLAASQRCRGGSKQKSINKIQRITRRTNLAWHLIRCRKDLWQNPAPLLKVIKVLGRAGIKVMLSTHNKGNLQQSHSQHRLKWRTQNISTKTRDKIGMHTLSLSFEYGTWSLS